MVVSRKKRRAEKRRRATAGAGMHRGVFGEVTGASRELRRCSHCAGEEGHKGNFKSEPLLSVSAPCAPPNCPPPPRPPLPLFLTNTWVISLSCTQTRLFLFKHSHSSFSLCFHHSLEIYHRQEVDRHSRNSDVNLQLKKIPTFCTINNSSTFQNSSHISIHTLNLSNMAYLTRY